MLKSKVIILFVVIFSLLAMSTISLAIENGTVYLESNQDVIEKGEEVEITVNLKDVTTAACNFFLYFDEDKWDYLSKMDNTNVEKNRILFVWYDTNGGRSAKQGELVKFRFKAKENGLSTFSIEGDFYNSVGQKLKVDFQEKQVQIGKEETIFQQQEEEEKGDNEQKGNANLEVLRLDREGMTPAFDKNITEYYLTVTNEVKEIEVLAITSNPEASVEITGNTKLKEGLNIIKIQVTSEDKKEKKTYTIQVTRTANLALANTNLEILAIENVLLSPPFDPNETNYAAEVAKGVNDLNVFAVPENEKATVQISGDKNLKEGNNTVTVVVTAANGFSKKKYQIQVYQRNEEEQKQYEEEQKEQIQKVEQAYQIQEMKEEQNSNTGGNDSKTGKYGVIIGIGAITIITVIGVIIKIISKKKKQ